MAGAMPRPSTDVEVVAEAEVPRQPLGRPAEADDVALGIEDEAAGIVQHDLAACVAVDVRPVPDDRDAEVRTSRKAAGGELHEGRVRPVLGRGRALAFGRRVGGRAVGVVLQEPGVTVLVEEHRRPERPDDVDLERDLGIAHEGLLVRDVERSLVEDERPCRFCRRCQAEQCECGHGECRADVSECASHGVIPFWFRPIERSSGADPPIDAGTWRLPHGYRGHNER